MKIDTHTEAVSQPIKGRKTFYIIFPICIEKIMLMLCEATPNCVLLLNCGSFAPVIQISLGRVTNPNYRYMLKKPG